MPLPDICSSREPPIGVNSYVINFVINSIEKLIFENCPNKLQIKNIYEIRLICFALYSFVSTF